jgi:hypothetical protein
MRKATGFLPALALGVAGAVSAGTPSLATPITYVETATGASGFLGPTPFTGATVTLTMTNDITNVTTPSTGIFNNVQQTLEPLMLNISTIGMTTFTDMTKAVVNQSVPDAGFGDITTNRAILFTKSATFSTYNLKTAVEPPVSGTAIINSTPPLSYQTVDGAFTLTSVTSVNFAATVGAVPALLIGRGPPVVLAFGSLLFGAKLLERSKKRRFLGNAAA